MIEVYTTDTQVLLSYKYEIGNPQWLAKKLGLITSDEIEEEVILSRTFLIKKADYINNSDDENDDVDFESGEYTFVIGKRVNQYYLLDKEILCINFDVYIHESIELSKECFIQTERISVFRAINEIYNEERLYIGGPVATISGSNFDALLKHFPNSYEINLYIHARVSTILRNETSLLPDYQFKHEQYLNRKDNYKPRLQDDEQTIILNDIFKFEMTVEKLKNMLSNSIGFSEKEWQIEIVKVIQTLYPKYIQIIEKMRITDYASHNQREIDITLVDSSGYIDIVEIKKPQNANIMYDGQYRNNYVPIRELQGSIMQVENYILSLIKMGSEGEKRLNDKYSLGGLCLKVVNPKGIVIMGLETDMNDKQKNDFEIVKRMYSNIVDIITYDELIKRLTTISNALKLRASI